MVGMNDLYFDNNKPVTLKMLPVCDCGYVFRNGIHIEEFIDEAQGYKYPIYSIDPSRCPNCRRLIDGVVIEPNKVKRGF